MKYIFFCFDIFASKILVSVYMKTLFNQTVITQSDCQ